KHVLPKTQNELEIEMKSITSRRPTTVRLALEALEDRLAPATLTITESSHLDVNNTQDHSEVRRLDSGGVLTVNAQDHQSLYQSGCQPPSVPAAAGSVSTFTTTTDRLTQDTYANVTLRPDGTGTVNTSEYTMASG